MEIDFNNQKITLPEDANLLDFIALKLGEKQNGIAVAVNNAIIKKEDWSAKKLKSNDSIIIIKATQGG